MFKQIIFKSFKADIKFIIRDPMLLMASLAPVMLILVLRLVFPLISGIIFLKTGFLIDNYYTITAISLISVIPMLFGMVYAFILLDESDMHILQAISVTATGKMNFLIMRILVPVFLSFILVLFSILLTHPVPSEGWLRSLYITLLLSTQSSFSFLFIGSFAGNKIQGLALSKLYGVFLVAVPLGLILHHPWNYFAFFSPLYWISWAWITPFPSESLIYGAISLILTSVCIIIFFRHFINKHAK